MTKHRVQYLAAALALVLLALGPVALVLAQDKGGTEQEVTLTGQLDRTDDGGYVLIDEDSGTSIALEGPSELADHVGSKVNVTGTWGMSGDNRVFKVTKVAAAT